MWVRADSVTGEHPEVVASDKKGKKAPKVLTSPPIDCICSVKGDVPRDRQDGHSLRIKRSPTAGSDFGNLRHAYYHYIIGR